MALKGLYVAMVTMALLFGNHNCVAETVRSLGKPLIQTVSLTVNPLNESHTAYVGLFLGPPDTEVIYKGKTVDTYLGRDHVFEALIVVDNFYVTSRMITVKSNSTGEKIEIDPNFNFNPRTQTSFFENSCDVGIGKMIRDNRTEFTATVRSCRNKNKPSLSFIAHLSYLSNDPFSKEIQDLNSLSYAYPRNPNFHKYFYSYHNSNDDGIYHANLDFPALKADGYNFHSLVFAIRVSNFDLVFDDTVTFKRKWLIEIMNDVN